MKLSERRNVNVCFFAQHTFSYLNSISLSIRKIDSDPLFQHRYTKNNNNVFITIIYFCEQKMHAHGTQNSRVHNTNLPLAQSWPVISPTQIMDYKKNCLCITNHINVILKRKLSIAFSVF